MFEYVENDTLPIIYGTITDDDGITPINLFGYQITLHIAYPVKLIKDAIVYDVTTGEFMFTWARGDLRAGTWNAEIQIISPEGTKTIQKDINNAPLIFNIAGEIG